MGDPTENVILVIDDEELILENFAAFLEDEEYTFYTANNSKTALDILEEKEIDIAIVDIKLPCHDGNYLILNGNKVSPNTLYLIHTGSSDYEIPQELYDIGVKDEHLCHKPIPNMAEFFEKATEMLEEKRISKK